MATASFTSGNDYNVFKSRPSSLPINDIMRAFISKENFWTQGAQRVRARYDSILDLELSKPENIQIRDEFIKKSQEDLQKLSSKDLADPNIQKAGINLFTPLLQDKAVMYDDQATKHKNKILADAERYRRDENGKFYSDSNLQYALDGWDDFLNAPNRDAGADYLKKAKDFTPYYNPSDEISKINKECGTNSFSNEVASGPYIEGTSDKSKSASKLYGCLEAGLSPQAKQQLTIEGHVAYGKNYEALQRDFLDASTQKKKLYQQELGSAQARKAALSKTKGNEEQVAAIDQEINGLSSQLSSIDSDINSYASWDEKFIKNNYDKLAYTGFSNRWKEAYSKAFSTSDISKTTKTNPIYIAEFTQNQINQRTLAGFQHDEAMSDKSFNQDVAMENIKFQNKLLLGQDEQGNKLDAIARVKMLLRTGMHPDEIQQYIGTATEETKSNATTLASNIASLQSKELEIDNDIFTRLRSEMPTNDLLSSIGDNVNNPDDIKRVWRIAHDYLQSANPNDPLAQQIKEAENLRHTTSNERSAIEGVYNIAKDNVTRNNPNLYQDYTKVKNEIAPTIKESKLADGTIIDRVRGLQIAEGRDPRFKLDKLQNGSNDPQAIYIRDAQTGKLVEELPSVINAAFKLSSVNTKTSTNYNQKLDEELGKSVLTQRNVLLTGNVFSKGSRANDMISQLVGGSLGELGKDYIPTSVGGLDPVTGKVRVQITDKEGAMIPASKIMDAFSKSGAGLTNYDLVDENTVSLSLPDARNLISIPKNDLVLRELVTSAELNVNSRPSGFIIPVGRGKDQIKYDIKVSKKIGGGTTYEIVGNGRTIPYLPKGKEDVISKLNLLLNGQ